MKEDNSFFKSFMKGFTGDINSDIEQKTGNYKYPDTAFQLLENIFKKMSNENETEEKLFYKE
jgi:hypothetical protein